MSSPLANVLGPDALDGAALRRARLEAWAAGWRLINITAVADADARAVVDRIAAQQLGRPVDSPKSDRRLCERDSQRVEADITTKGLGEVVDKNSFATARSRAATNHPVGARRG